MKTQTVGIELTARQAAALDQVLRMRVIQMSFAGIRLRSEDGVLHVEGDNFPDDIQVAADGSIRTVLP